MSLGQQLIQQLEEILAVLVHDRQENNKWDFLKAELWSIDQVASYLAIDKRTVAARVAAGQFPQPKRLGRKILRWRAAAVRNYVERGIP